MLATYAFLRKSPLINGLPQNKAPSEKCWHAFPLSMFLFKSIENISHKWYQTSNVTFTDHGASHLQEMAIPWEKLKVLWNYDFRIFCHDFWIFKCEGFPKSTKIYPPPPALKCPLLCVSGLQKHVHPKSPIYTFLTIFLD